MLTTVTELPEYIRCANELLNEAERKSVIDTLQHIHGRAISWKVLAVSVSFAGLVAVEEKVAVFESFTTTMTNEFRAIYLPFSEKMKNQTSQNMNVTSLPSWLMYLYKLR